MLSNIPSYVELPKSRMFITLLKPRLKKAENILEAVQDTQRRNWTKYITTDVAMFNLSRGYGKMRVYYV